MSEPTERKQVRMARSSREQQLLNIAIEIFVAHGYQGTAIEDIASAAGVTRPVVYKCFGSKDGIYLACLRHARGLLDSSLLERARHVSELDQRLRLGIEGYFSFAANHRSAWRLLYESGIAVAGSAAEEATLLRLKTVSQIVELFRPAAAGVSDLRLEVFAHAASGAGEQLAKWWVLNPHVSQQDVVDEMFRFTWQGVRSLAARNP